MRLCLLMLVLPAAGMLHAQRFITEDIPRFWQAYDALATAKDRKDSVACFQRLYLDRASKGLRRFMRVRRWRADQFVQAARFTEFWSSIRAGTLRIQDHREPIEELFRRYEAGLPGFRRPDLCFAIGTLSTGGTVSNGWILVGAEIACADSTTATHELDHWLRSVMDPSGLLLPLLAHEAAHTRQRAGPRALWGFLTSRLLAQSMMEGVADFITREVAGLPINQQLQAYGRLHGPALWDPFKQAMRGNEISGWLYQGPASTDPPADMGYFMGARMAEAYYTAARDKRRALKVLLRTGAAGKVMRHFRSAPVFPGP